jgi:hypothetical protein
MIKFVFLFSFTFLNHPSLFAKDEGNLAVTKTECIGSESAKYGAIYFHGMDSVLPSDQEQSNRKMLKTLSDQFSVRIAFPRSALECPNSKNQICWGWKFDRPETSSALKSIEKVSENCKLPNTKFLIGFSNGAYLLNKLFRQCDTKAEQIIISQGANIYSGQLESDPSSLAGCGKLIFISGINDKYNYDPKNNYTKQLKSKNANVQHFEFNGGHEMNLEALKKFFTAELK